MLSSRPSHKGAANYSRIVRNTSLGGTDRLKFGLNGPRSCGNRSPERSPPSRWRCSRPRGSGRRPSPAGCPGTGEAAFPNDVLFHAPSRLRVYKL